MKIGHDISFRIDDHAGTRTNGLRLPVLGPLLLFRTLEEPFEFVAKEIPKRIREGLGTCRLLRGSIGNDMNDGFIHQFRRDCKIKGNGLSFTVPCEQGIIPGVSASL